MPLSLVVEFDGPCRMANDPLTGRLAHGWFFEDLLVRVAPALAGRLHAQTRHKPFTVSPLLAPVSGRNVGTATGGSWLRVTALNDELSSLLSALTASDIGAAHFGGFHARAVNVTCESTSHPWASRMAMADLLRVAQDASLVTRSVSWEFLTPTAFSGEGDTLQLYPTPSLLLRGLALRWNSTSAFPIDDDDIDDVCSCAQVEQYELRTVAVSGPLSPGPSSTDVAHFGRARPRERGFVGTCTLALPRNCGASLIGWFHLLAAWSLFSGVGRRTAMGWGQVSVKWPRWRPAIALPGLAPADIGSHGDHHNRRTSSAGAQHERLE